MIGRMCTGPLSPDTYTDDPGRGRIPHSKKNKNKRKRTHSERITAVRSARSLSSGPKTSSAVLLVLSPPPLPTSDPMTASSSSSKGDTRAYRKPFVPSSTSNSAEDVHLCDLVVFLLLNKGGGLRRVRNGQPYKPAGCVMVNDSKSSCPGQRNTCPKTQLPLFGSCSCWSLEYAQGPQPLLLAPAEQSSGTY